MMERGIRKILTFEILSIAAKIYFRENKTEAYDDRRDTNFIAPLGMHF